MINCPFCKKGQGLVIGHYGRNKDPYKVVRFRKCTACGRNYKTTERIVDMDDYDKWKTTPPEAPESMCKCFECGTELYPFDEYYRLNEEVYCPDCAAEWLDMHKYRVTEEMSNG